jgi:acyl carrier protein
MVGCNCKTTQYNGGDRMSTVKINEEDGLISLLRKLIADVLDVEEREVGYEKSFSDLGVDSLISMQIIIALEKSFDINLDEEELKRLNSLKDVHNLIAMKSTY